MLYMDPMGLLKYTTLHANPGTSLVSETILLNFMNHANDGCDYIASQNSKYQMLQITIAYPHTSKDQTK